MSSLLQRLFKRKEEAAQDTKESFAGRYHRFKQFLSASMDGHSSMMAFEERLASDRPVGMPFFRSLVARLGIAGMQCILQLQALGGERFSRLNEPFSLVRSKIKEVLEAKTYPLDGPLVVWYKDISAEHEPLVAPSILKVEALQKSLPEFIPQGFVITGAAWWQFANTPELYDEIDRLMLVSQGDPNSYHEASMAIREHIVSSMPLPEGLKAEIEVAFEKLKDDLVKPGMALLVRCLPVRSEHGVLILPEQVINTPVADAEALFQAVLKAFTLAYRPRAMIYRLKLGIRDRGMPFCISITLFSTEHARGSSYRNLDTKNSDDLTMHIRRNSTVHEGESTLDITSLPEGMLTELEEDCGKALSCFSDAPIEGNRHEIYWMASANGDFSILGAMALPDPDLTSIDTPLPLFAKTVTLPHLFGGECNYPGIAAGNACVVRNFQDALQFPIGSILVVEQATPRWAFMLDFAVGAFACEATKAGPFAQVARRYGRPSVLGMCKSLDGLPESDQLLLLANIHSAPALCACPCAEKSTEPSIPEYKNKSTTGLSIAEQITGLEKKEKDNSEEKNCVGSIALLPVPQKEEDYPEYLLHLCTRAREYTKNIDKGHNLETGHLWLLKSDIAEMAKSLAPLLAALTLPDSDSSDFRADNCHTIHDFLAYCNNHVVKEMYKVGSTTKSAQAPAKQLIVDDVLKQFYIINLSDGYRGEIKGPAVNLLDITSIPMLNFWRGFSAKPWEGPPQVNVKGLLATIFEATQNPNLDPSLGHSHYSEKNIFLIAKHFCSMRCRFGFHYLMLDCFFSERPRERFLVFQFKGGAANVSRRKRRVHFIAELLAQVDCPAEVVGDALMARMEGGAEEDMKKMLKVIGYLFMHTRQLDMIMADEQALAVKRAEMLEDMLALVEGRPLNFATPVRT